jgi:hypothetical protein
VVTFMAHTAFADSTRPCGTSSRHSTRSLWNPWPTIFER